MARDFDPRFEMEVAPPEIVQVARLKATPILDSIPEEDDVDLIQDVQMESSDSPSLSSDWSHSDRELMRAFLQKISQEEDI